MLPIASLGMLLAAPNAASEPLPVAAGAVDARVLSIDRLRVDRRGKVDFAVRYDALSPQLEANDAHLLTEQLRLTMGSGLHLGAGWYATAQLPMLLRQSGFHPETGQSLTNVGIEQLDLGFRTALVTARYFRVGAGVVATLATGSKVDPYTGHEQSSLSPWASFHTGTGLFDGALALVLLPLPSGDAMRSTVDGRIALSTDVALVGEWAGQRSIVDGASSWGALGGTTVQLGPEWTLRTLVGRDIHFAPTGIRMLAAADYHPRPRRVALPERDAPRPSRADFERWEQFLAEVAPSDEEETDSAKMSAEKAELAAVEDANAEPKLDRSAAVAPPPGEGWDIMPRDAIEKRDSLNAGWAEVLSDGGGLFFEGERLDIRSDPAVRALAERIEARPNVHTRIEIGVQASGDPKADFQLSQARGQRLRDMLLTYGLSGRRIDAVGLGADSALGEGVRIIVIEESETP